MANTYVCGQIQQYQAAVLIPLMDKLMIKQSVRK